MKIRKPVGPSDRCGVSNAEKIFGSRGACAPLLLSPFIIMRNTGGLVPVAMRRRAGSGELL